jgi:hypothetical protein
MKAIIPGIRDRLCNIGFLPYSVKNKDAYPMQVLLPPGENSLSKPRPSASTGLEACWENGAGDQMRSGEQIGRYRTVCQSLLRNRLPEPPARIPENLAL